MKTCKCCGQTLVPKQVRIEWLDAEAPKYIGRKWDDEWFIWDVTKDKNFLPENAVRGKWEDREKLFK